MADVTVSDAGPGDIEACLAVAAEAFGGARDPDEHALDRRVLPTARPLAARDGSRVVGTAAAFAFELTVPGALLPAAGVTEVAVRPSHRRRGVLRALMDHQLARLHAGGEPVAVLWASEAAIYGRFGYGLASTLLSVRVPRGMAAEVARAGDDRGLDLADPADCRAELASVYDRVRPDRPGFYRRDADAWEMRLFDPPAGRNDASPLRAVVHRGPDGADGYALYATRRHWEDAVPAGTTTVREVVAANPVAAATLWGYLLDLDLTTATEAWTSTGDPLLHLLADPRRASPRWKDNLYLRVVDVPRALAGRRYAAPVDTVLAVADPQLAANSGHWRLRTDGATTSCERTDAAADLELSVRDLGAAYLGGTSLATLAASGRVAERRAGAVDAATTAFGWPVPPFCPQIF